MSFRSVTLAVLSALLLIGCATKEQQSTARANRASENDDMGGWDEFRTWNRMGADHVNVASEARRSWVPPSNTQQR